MEAPEFAAAIVARAAGIQNRFSRRALCRHWQHVLFK
jgi:hypothetical protein